MPSRIRSRITDSVPQEGPMVQMILARRCAGETEVPAAADSAEYSPVTRFSLLSFNGSPVEIAYFACAAFTDFDSPRALSSLPSMALGKSMALNSAPTSTTREIMYIHTSRAMLTPSEP